MKKCFLVTVLILSALVNAQQAPVGAQPVFENGEAQPVPAFSDSNNWIRHDLWVETSFDTDGDGQPDRMHVAVTRPQQTETEGLKLPVIYATSPYFAGVAPDTPGMFWDVKHELGEMGPERAHPEVTPRNNRPIISNSYLRAWLPRGYIVVHSSSPGTGLSQGAPTIGGENESLAPKAVIEWLCGRGKGYTEPYGGEEVKAYWSTGKVGMTGTSYNGTLPVAAAMTGVEGLEAIIPVAPVTSWYQYYRSNGLVRSPGGYLGEDVDVLYDFVHSGDPGKRAYNNRTIRDGELKNGMDRQTGDFNDFWEGRDYLLKMDKMKAALYMSHGFNDWNVMTEHSYRIYKAAKEKGLPAKIYYHQAGHGGPPPMKEMNRWFTRFLFGVENGVEDEPKSLIVREGDPRNQPTSYPDYPHPDARRVTLYPAKGAPGQGSLVEKPSRRKRVETFQDNYNFKGADLAQASSSPNRLIYLSPLLKEDLHLSGVAEVNIRLASSKPAANLSVWLVSLPWNPASKAPITDNIITRGWADPQNHLSLREGTPLRPGTFYDLKFTLQPDDQVIPKDQQIGFLIFSTDPEFTIWPTPGTELTVDLSGTALHLPVVGGENAYRAATE